jgi:tartrate dehydratase beta subunit/fumarate hydratase class I family protein
MEIMGDKLLVQGKIASQRSERMEALKFLAQYSTDEEMKKNATNEIIKLAGFSV